MNVTDESHERKVGIPLDEEALSDGNIDLYKPFEWEYICFELENGTRHPFWDLVIYRLF